MRMSGEELIKFIKENDLLSQEITFTCPQKLSKRKQFMAHKCVTPDRFGREFDFGDMELTTKSWNCLKRAYICSVSELKDYVDEKVKSTFDYEREHPLASGIRNLGETNEREILNEMRKELKRRSK